MKLKRNILTILYTILFLFVTGFGLFQMTNLIVSTVPNKYIVTSIIIFGLIIYLIVAFFIKEADTLRIIENKSVLMILLECMLVFVCGGLLFYTQWMGYGMAPAVIYTLLLLSMYATARLCGGRLCGMLCIAVTFYMFLQLSSTDLITTESAIDMLCFLLPFAIFSGYHRVLVPCLGNSGFVMVVAYLVLGFVFSLAIAINPFVCVLLAGCVFSLFFATSRQKEQSKVVNGIIFAGLLVIFTIGFLFCIRLMIPNILGMPDWKLDRNLPLALQADTLCYIVNKYTNPVIYLHLQFFYGILPILLFFFSFLAGYYTIRNKTSYLGPLILSQVVLFVYYIGFCEGGSQFYYLNYLLPVFAAYGFSNTLLSDPSDRKQTAELPEEPVQEEPAPVQEPVGAEPEATVIQPAEATLLPESDWVPETEPTTLLEPGTMPLSEETPEPELVLEIAEPDLSPEQTDVPKKKEKKKKKKKDKAAGKMAQTAIPTVSKKDDIPEWTIPGEFLAPDLQVEDDYLLPQEAPVQEAEPVEEMTEEMTAETIEDPAEETTIIPDVDDSLDLDQFVAEEPAFTPDMLTVPEPEQSAEDTIISDAAVLESDSILKKEDTDQVDMLLHDGSNDLEQFVSNGADADEEGMLVFSDEPATLPVVEEVEEEPDVLQQEEQVEVAQIEEEQEIAQVELEQIETEQEVAQVEAEQEEETQLNDLLDRLDMSEPIKRMNESAQEDIADVIEREEEQVELSEALPLKPSKSALPKYKKPNFDFAMEPVSIPLDDQFSTISEYDEVPTVHDLENQWKTDTKPVIETVATKVEEPSRVEEPLNYEQPKPEEPPVEQTAAPVRKEIREESVHSEQIVRKNGIGKRSYHKITIR